MKERITAQGSMTGEHVMESLLIGPVSLSRHFHALNSQMTGLFFGLGLIGTFVFSLSIPTGSDAGRYGTKYARDGRANPGTKDLTSAEVVKYLRPAPFFIYGLFDTLRTHMSLLLIVSLLSIYLVEV
ncbi:uncharacterized protein BP01DRAFT_191408 [Aspergillus saccharolyticus JOP 1030-1]|uniref:Uncharacterized protein n=1 Tax=Aspergillus saccharolyticus JOP 1030-1 TaxID=1450539 RepID=A0A318Z1L0_9EURO|nr:hypothetical protein BP01DRAFT_191408 [Aspergillus saccharolyticus JOP 1030-1]PYH40906.1 hypothetical protein BP01DRAFT_191408 [Aspergillus saccharolyticus JOP 1030-1]